MKLPYSWLSDYTKINENIHDYTAHMTMTGSKVESWEVPSDSIANVVCARVLSIEKHPNSDHLVICQMDIGNGAPVQIVTGASNLTVGDLVPAALHNSKLPGGVEIKKTTMRGVDSNGMLCSIGELNLTQNDLPYANPNGILVLEEEGAKPGDDICAVLGLDDTIIDFEITPNRPDCLSIIGLARESSASFDTALNIHEPCVSATSGDIREHLTVAIEDPDLCMRYTAGMVRDITIAPSPAWMRKRLRDSGIRPINNIVDITNYVMLEYGQPMHAFDYACIADSKIIVRRSKKGEHMTTLDSQPHALPDNTLVISDPQKAIGIAGVMGGENSEITENTKLVVFESAAFSGPSIRVSSRKAGLRTEASGRFEKGLNSDNTMPALLRALELVQQLKVGTVLGGIIDIYPSPKKPRVIALEPERICRFIGADIPQSDMVKTLKSFGFTVNGLDVTVPSWRDDVVGMADLAEEVARIYGYDKIEPTLFSGQTTTGGLTREQNFTRLLSGACFSVGFNEAKTLSFMSAKSLDKVLIPKDSTLRLTTVISNPLGEDQSMMRTTTLPAMLESVARNYNFRAPKLRLFEQGTIYLPKIKDGKADLSELPCERSILTLAMYGTGDFFALKGCITTMLENLSISGYKIIPCSDNASYHPGRCGEMVFGTEHIGYLGQIHPLVAANYGIGTEVYMAELDVELLFSHVDKERLYSPLPKYPAVTRDIAVTVDESVYVLQLEDVIRAAAGKRLENLKLFDVYRGAQVLSGKKSVAFSLALRSPDHTLTDIEADEIMSKILKQLEKEYNAVLRA